MHKLNHKAQQQRGVGIKFPMYECTCPKVHYNFSQIDDMPIPEMEIVHAERNPAVVGVFESHATDGNRRRNGDVAFSGVC